MYSKNHLSNFIDDADYYCSQASTECNVSGNMMPNSRQNAKCAAAAMSEKTTYHTDGENHHEDESVDTEHLQQ